MKQQVEESIWATIAGLVLPPALSDNLHILKYWKSESLEIKIYKNVKIWSDNFQNDSSNYLRSGTTTSKEAICWANPSKCWNILASCSLYLDRVEIDSLCHQIMINFSTWGSCKSIWEDARTHISWKLISSTIHWSPRFIYSPNPDTPPTLNGRWFQALHRT